MTKKKEEPTPSLDDLTVKDLASLFCLSGLLTSPRWFNAEPQVAAKKATEFADAWVKERKA